jgi:hypothetical protein
MQKYAQVIQKGLQLNALTKVGTNENAFRRRSAAAPLTGAPSLYRASRAAKTLSLRYKRTLLMRADMSAFRPS